MTKDDKQFLKTLITDLKIEIKDIKTDITDMKTDFGTRFDKLKGETHRNGILLEKYDDYLMILSENYSTLNQSVAEIKLNVHDVKEMVFDYPILRNTVKKHSKQIADLTLA